MLVTEPSPEVVIIQEHPTEVDAGNTPQPSSEAHESAQEKETEEPIHTDQVEGGQSDSLAKTKPDSAQPPPIEAGDNSRQLVPASPSSGLLTAFEVHQLFNFTYPLLTLLSPKQLELLSADYAEDTTR